MARPKKIKLQFDLSIKNFAKLSLAAFLHPKLFVASIPAFKKTYTPAVTFLLFNLSFGNIVAVIVRQAIDLNHPSFFFAISQLIFIIPIFFIGAVCFFVLLFAIAKILGGQGSLKETLNHLMFSSLPLSFIGVSYFGDLSILMMLVLTILSLKKVHQYNLFLATVTAALPILGLITLAAVSGVGY